MKNNQLEIKYLEHCIYSDSYFVVTTKEDNLLKVSAQLHELRSFYAVWDSESETWDTDGDEDIIDYFYLTEYESGSQFQEVDLKDYFKIEEHRLDWQYLAMPYHNWCGIQRFEPIEQSNAKWIEYKKRFPKITSKDQFTYDNVGFEL